LRGRIAVANTTLARNVRLGRLLGDRDDTGRPLRSIPSKDGSRARRRGARPRAADRDRGAAFGRPRAPAHSGALDVRRRAHGAQRPGADRVRALPRSRSRIELRRGAGIRSAPPKGSRRGRKRECGQGRSSGSSDRHRRRQAFVPGDADDPGRRPGSSKIAAFHAALDHFDDDAHRFCGRRSSVRSAQGCQRLGGKGRRPAGAGAGARRFRGRVLQSRAT
jgi:hypothetical protein